MPTFLVALLLLAAASSGGGTPATVAESAAVLDASFSSILSSTSGRQRKASDHAYSRRRQLSDTARLRAASGRAAVADVQTVELSDNALNVPTLGVLQHSRSSAPAPVADSAQAAREAPTSESSAGQFMAGTVARAVADVGLGAGAGSGIGAVVGTASPVLVLAPGSVLGSASVLSRLFSLVESERVRTRGGAPCPASDQRRALTCLLLAILVPPAAYLYYGYVVVGAVQIVLYLLCLTPLCFACGWFCRPVTPKYRRAGADPSLYESLSPAAEGIGSRTRALVILLVCAGLLFVALIMWQVALVVRVATNDFPPANGCPTVPL